MSDRGLTIENIKKEVEGREIVDVKLKDMVELLNKFDEDLRNTNLSEEKTLDECNSVVFNPLMEEYMGYRRAYIQNAIDIDEFKNMVDDFVKRAEFKELYDKAIVVIKSNTEECEEMSK